MTSLKGTSGADQLCFVQLKLAAAEERAAAAEKLASETEAPLQARAEQSDAGGAEGHRAGERIL